MQPSTPEPEKGWSPSARPDLLDGQHLPPPPQQERSRRKRDALLQSALALFAERSFYQHFASKRQILLVLMDRLLQEASMLTLEAKSAALPDIRDGIARLVRQALQVDWAYAGAYRAWREATVGDRELRTLHQQIEAWTAQQLSLLFRVLLLVPGARQGVDSETLAWELALLLLRLAEIPLEEPDAVVASLTNLMYHGLFTDSTG